MSTRRTRIGGVTVGTILSLLAVLPSVGQSGAPAPAPPPAYHPHRIAPPQQAAPIERRGPQQQAPIPQQGTPRAAMPQASAAPQDPGFRGKGEHLAGWMQAHGNLSPQQQMEALRNEPGFRDLPQPTQQRYMDRLTQLNAMPPDKRQHLLEQTEQMERLSPEQRAAVRSATLQWGALPPDEKHVVGKAFRDLRGMPPDQRLALLNNRYRDLSPQGRQALMQLMQVEPWMPPDHF